MSPNRIRTSNGILETYCSLHSDYLNSTGCEAYGTPDGADLLNKLPLSVMSMHIPTPQVTLICVVRRLGCQAVDMLHPAQILGFHLDTVFHIPNPSPNSIPLAHPSSAQ